MGKKAGAQFLGSRAAKACLYHDWNICHSGGFILFLAGDQLHLRQSRGNLDMPEAESGTVELVQGAVVEQKFSCEIQRLQRGKRTMGRLFIESIPVL